MLRDILKKISSLFKRRPPGTVRIMFSVLTVALFLGASVIGSNQVSYIKLVPSETIVAEGSRFSLDIFAFAHVPVNAVDITINFRPGSVEVLGVDRGQSVLTIWTEDPVIAKDKVTLAGGTFRRGFVGEHRIATLELRALKPGNSEFIVTEAELLAGDGRGTPVRVVESNNSAVEFLIYDENTDSATIGAAVNLAVVTDLDGDGKVTLRDVSAFMASWFSRDMVYDFNDDGLMTFRDFSIILASVFRAN